MVKLRKKIDNEELKKGKKTATFNIGNGKEEGNK